jgi:hypothetical protein
MSLAGTYRSCMPEARTLLVAPRAVLFDLDGTLVDSVPDLARCVNPALSSVDQPPANENEVRSWVGRGADHLLHRALTGLARGMGAAGYPAGCLGHVQWALRHRAVSKQPPIPWCHRDSHAAGPRAHSAAVGGVGAPAALAMSGQIGKTLPPPFHGAPRQVRVLRY